MSNSKSAMRLFDTKLINMFKKIESFIDRPIFFTGNVFGNGGIKADPDY